MKYTTFRNLAAGTALLIGLGTCFGVNSCCATQRAEEEQRIADEIKLRAEEMRLQLADKAAQEAKARADASAAAADSARRLLEDPAGFYATAPGLRQVDTDVLALLRGPVQEKIKDATKGKPYKVNLYSDDKVRWSRAKVDRNRNERWDESWTFKPDGKIERQVAPNDDEKYTQTFRLDVTAGWVDLAAPAVPTTSPTTPTASVGTQAADGLRAVDRDMFGLLKSAAVQEKIKDATKGKPYKINLYSDDGARWNRAKIDLNRNDKWDESWTFKDGATERQVAPGDDERYTEVWVLNGDAWKKKP